MIELSISVLLDPSDAIRQHEGRMRQAAVELRFELAGRIKQYMEELGVFAKGPFRHVRRLEDFRFVVLQAGPREGTAKVFLVTATKVSEVAGIINEPVSSGALLRMILDAAEASPKMDGGISDEVMDQIAVVTSHLFATRNSSGVFLPLSEVEDRVILKGYRDLQKQRRQGGDEGEDSDEGVMKELQPTG